MCVSNGIWSLDTMRICIVGSSIGWDLHKCFLSWKVLWVLYVIWGILSQFLAFVNFLFLHFSAQWIQFYYRQPTVADDKLMRVVYKQTQWTKQSKQKTWTEIRVKIPATSYRYTSISCEVNWFNNIINKMYRKLSFIFDCFWFPQLLCHFREISIGRA